MSYIKNSTYTNICTIDLKNTIISSVDVWTDATGVIGLRFQIFDRNTNIQTLIIGNSNGFKTFGCNSSFMDSKFLKIDSINGCIENERSYILFMTLKVQFSFSQCSFLNSNSRNLFSSSSTDSTQMSFTSITSLTTIENTNKNSTITTATDLSTTTTKTSSSSSTTTTTTSTYLKLEIVEGCITKSITIYDILWYLKKSI